MAQPVAAESGAEQHPTLLSDFLADGDELNDYGLGLGFEK